MKDSKVEVKRKTFPRVIITGEGTKVAKLQALVKK
jgi:hypothetical protein